jgi:predicted methyltransferase
MADLLVLAHLQASALLDARRRGMAMVALSLDLGLSVAEVALGDSGVALPDGQMLAWVDVQAIVEGEPICFVVEDNAARKIHRFSSTFNRTYSLMATAGAPTIINAGFTMHRIVGIDPRQDTERKIRALGTPRGRVLDTCTGLGYTAIAAARTAGRVLTIELDPLVMEIARLNPYSRPLFQDPRIESQIGDVAEVIASIPDEQFTQVIHDPPTLSLAGELYGGAFYWELFRVLRHGGTMFHYVGNLESKGGATVAKGVQRRLRESGFTRVTPRPEAFGFTASKG